METNRVQFSFTVTELALLLTLLASLSPLKFFQSCLLFAILYVPALFCVHGVNAFAIMEAKAAELLAVLKSNNHSVDTKVGQLTGLKSDIKQKNVPEGAVPPIFESLRVAIGSQHSALAGAGFSALGHFLRRLFIQNQHNLVSSHGRSLYPVLVDRLGDYKEKIRAYAAQAFTDIWPAASSEVEHHVLDVALVGKNPRAKETSMVWLVKMTQEHGLLFRPYVPNLVSCLEDADNGVRETAKKTVITLFRNAPPRAQSDLKKQLVILDVRKSIANLILTSIGLMDQDAVSIYSQPRSEIIRPASSISHYRPREEIERPKSVLSVRSHSHVDAAKDESKKEPDLPKRPKSVFSLYAHSDAPKDVLEMQHESESPKLIEYPMSIEAAKQPELPSDPEQLEYPEIANQHETQKQLELQRVVELQKEREPQKQLVVPKQRELSKKLAVPKPLDIPKSAASSKSGTTDSHTSPVSPVETPESDIDPLYVHSHKEIDDIVRGMAPHFEGRETEQNWGAREKSILTLRRLTRGNAPHDFSPHFIGAIKTLLDGILKVVNSLRTTLSARGCLLIQEVARTCGSGLDPMVEIILINLLKLCGAMKKISAQTCNTTVDTIIANVTYSSRLMQHMWLVCQEKNAQLRLFATGWLKTLINKQSRHKSSVEHGGGLELLERCIKKGLGDPNPAVRESMRGTFWAFYKVWPGKANEIMSTLDAKSMSLLEKDPANPNSGTSSLNDSSGGFRPAFSSSTSAAAKRPTLKETIAAQKKARQAAGKNLPPRPESAQSSFSDAKTTRPAATRAPTKSSAVRTVPTGTPLSSLSSAPMRPAIKPRRPEIARPATADPYARRPPTAGSQPKGPSPSESPQKAQTNSATTPGAKSSRLDTAPVSTTKSKPKRLDISTLSRGGSEDHLSTIPATSPPRSMPSPKELPSIDPVKVYEDPVPSASKEATSPTTTITSTTVNRSPRENRSPNSKENRSPNTTSSTSSSRSVSKSNALEELPLNEPAYRDNIQFPLPEEPFEGVETTSSENTQRRWRKVEISEKRRSISPRSKDPVKARDMIDKGIEKIRANAMDVHGYRKLQGLIKHHDSIFTDESKYDEMLMALLNDLEGPPDEKPLPLGRPLDLKTQVLVTIRLLFDHKNPYIPAYYPRVTTAILNARKHYELTSHIVSGLEQTVDKIVASCKPHGVMEAVLELLETENRDDEGYRAIGMGLYVLNGLIHRLNNAGTRASQPILERIGKFAQRCLNDPRPEVRCATTELCVELHKMIPNKDQFFKLVDSPMGDHKNLLTYYIEKARR